MSPLTTTTRLAATGPVLKIIGDLDYETASELRKALDSLSIAAGQTLVLDLAGLDFCDSSGISALISARNLAIEQGGAIALAAVPANTLRILGIVGLDQVFTILSDPATATNRDLMTG
ncbi:STAS domain-containing protein [Streptomyces cyaneofuscatus]|uniref:STAS domain-containing protein n=1 Tax=Streptomyces TaxID=1883 RepID=UPI000D5202CF|nr:STAS domain-containing protein [Streptomyces sp. CS090A]PVC80755.1 anti-anti-sigma factor [Streptomyces sp. CS090A]